MRALLVAVLLIACDPSEPEPTRGSCSAGYKRCGGAAVGSCIDERAECCSQEEGLSCLRGEHCCRGGGCCADGWTCDDASRRCIR